MAAYLTLLEAQALFDERLNTEAWDDSDDSTRTKALAMATKIIDRLNYQGNKAISTQPNEFPRCEDTVVPPAVQEATSELALALLDGIDPEIEYENLFLTSQGYANVRSTYDRSVPAPNVVAGIPSIAAWRLLKPYLRDPNYIELNRIS